MSGHNRRRWAYAAVAIALVAVIAGRAWSIWASRNRPHGKYTAKQVLAKAEPLCRAVLQKDNSIKLTAVAHTVTTMRGDRRLWSVYGERPDGTLDAFLLVDADTGDDFVLYDATPAKKNRPGEELTRDQALRMAQAWMHDLGVARKAPHWKLKAETMSPTMGWSFVWRAGGREARIVVDSRNGDLLNADLRSMAAPAS